MVNGHKMCYSVTTFPIKFGWFKKFIIKFCSIFFLFCINLQVLLILKIFKSQKSHFLLVLTMFYWTQSFISKYQKKIFLEKKLLKFLMHLNNFSEMNHIFIDNDEISKAMEVWQGSSELKLNVLSRFAASL